MNLITIFVNNQIDAQFFYSNSLQVSNNQVLIIRRVNCINTTSGICHCMWVTVWYAGLDGVPSKPAQRSYWYNWLSWRWALGCSKHVENWNKEIKEKESLVKLVIYKEWPFILFYFILLVYLLVAHLRTLWKAHTSSWIVEYVKGSTWKRSWPIWGTKLAFVLRKWIGPLLPVEGDVDYYARSFELALDIEKGKSA